MNAPKISLKNQAVVAPAYGAYGQIVKMLLPSSGCLAIYAVDGDLAWCSDGFERPDFRGLLDEIRRSESGPAANQGQLRKTGAGVSAVVARLCDSGGTALGFVLIELGGATTSAASSMAVSLTRPLFACLAAQLALERKGTIGMAKVAESPAAAPVPHAAAPIPHAPAPVILAAAPQPPDARLEFLLGAGEVDLTSPQAIKQLLRRCVEQLDCLSAVFCIPDQELTETAERATPTDDATRARLDANRRHLLAWAQLNNRPMIVNRIDEAKSPYKILSAPIPGRNGKSGLLALFRAAGSANFELDDVRLIEFIGRLAMALQNERRDALTGLLNRASFERQLEESLRSAAGAEVGMLLHLDIEALSRVNAAFGFRVGDEVIRRAAQLIRRALVPPEIACRLAGDSFVVHLPGRDAAGAAAFGTAIATAAAEFGYTAGGSRVPLSLCFGTAAPDAAAASARHWIAAAELACQQARTNRVKPSL